MFSGYRYIAAGKYPTEKEKGAQMYQDFDNGLGREQTAQMRAEVEHNRLEVPSVRTARPDGEGVPRRGKVTRGAALVTALFR